MLARKARSSKDGEGDGGVHGHVHVEVHAGNRA